MKTIQVMIFSVWFVGVMTGYCMAGADTSKIKASGQSKTEFLPILSYDTDAGLGYGMKVFALNHFRLNESFDMVLFNSTKGERWYRLVFSVPDFELRQGTAYAWALDLTIDYDKWISYGFFGVGNTSRFDDQESYTREPLEISLVLNRGFTEHFVGQLGAKYKSIADMNFSAQSKLVNISPTLNASTATTASVVGTLRYDTRNSFINASNGVVIQGEAELAPLTGMSNVAFTRLAGLFQHYTQLFSSKAVVASRIRFEGLIGDEIPVQFLLPIGGTGTLRGYPQDRYLDKIAAVANVEVRVPIVWRFGGVVGLDAGKVWHALSDLDLPRWAIDPMVGLRFTMDTFVVRLDVGFGKETTGLYLNFGQLF